MLNDTEGGRGVAESESGTVRQFDFDGYTESKRVFSPNGGSQFTTGFTFKGSQTTTSRMRRKKNHDNAVPLFRKSAAGEPSKKGQVRLPSMWPCVERKLASRLVEALNAEQGVDLLLVAPLENFEMKVHSLVLGCFSLELQGHITRAQCEHRDKFGQYTSALPVIKIHNATQRTVLLLLQIIYTDTCAPSAEDCMDLYNVAAALGMTGLARRCYSHLAAPHVLTPQMACSLLLLKDQHQDHRFAINYVCTNFQRCADQPDFLKVTAAQLIAVASNERLMCREIDLFNALVAWAKAQNKEDVPDAKAAPAAAAAAATTPDNKSCTTSTTVEQSAEGAVTNNAHPLRALLKDLLPHVRFPLMTPDEFANYVVPTHILTMEEQLEVFLWRTYMDNPDEWTMSPKPKCKSFITRARMLMQYPPPPPKQQSQVMAVENASDAAVANATNGQQSRHHQVLVRQTMQQMLQEDAIVAE